MNMSGGELCMRKDTRKGYRIHIVLDETIAEKLKQLQQEYGFLTLGEVVRFVLGRYFEMEGDGK